MLVTDMLGGQVMIDTVFTRGAFDSDKKKTHNSKRGHFIL